MKTMTTSPRIYVACLAAYNNGQLHGEWIDATQSSAAILDEVMEMLKASPQPNAEEWAIHDHEGFMGLTISESMSFDDVAELAEVLEERGQAFADYVANQGTGMDGDLPSVDEFQEAYQGEHGSEQAFAESLADDLGMMTDWPETAKTYFDWESWTRDLFLGDYWMSSNGHVFRSI